MECDNNAKKENNNCENTPSNHQKEKEDTFCNDKDVTWIIVITSIIFVKIVYVDH